jgi:hypothetical protein
MERVGSIFNHAGNGLRCFFSWLLLEGCEPILCVTAMI